MLFCWVCFVGCGVVVVWLLGCWVVVAVVWWGVVSEAKWSLEVVSGTCLWNLSPEMVSGTGPLSHMVSGTGPLNWSLELKWSGSDHVERSPDSALERRNGIPKRHPKPIGALTKEVVRITSSGRQGQHWKRKRA